MRVRYTPRARRDVRAILHYLEERNPQGALNVKQTIRKTIDLIGNHPRSGRFAGIERTRRGLWERCGSGQLMIPP